LMLALERAHAGALHEVLRIMSIAREAQCEAPESRQQRRQVRGQSMLPHLSVPSDERAARYAIAAVVTNDYAAGTP
jgi:hypothetical protein